MAKPQYQQGSENRNCRVTGLAHKALTLTLTTGYWPIVPHHKNKPHIIPAAWCQEQAKGKNYHDTKKKAQHCSIIVGDQVLIRSEKKGKVALPWHANPFLIRAVKEDLVLVEDGNRQRLMRHSTAVKKLPTTAGITTPNAPKTISGRSPRRSRKRQPEYNGFSSTAWYGFPSMKGRTVVTEDCWHNRSGNIRGRHVLDWTDNYSVESYVNILFMFYKNSLLWALQKGC